MTYHLIIQRQNGRITSAIVRDLASRTSPLLPKPIDQVLLSEEDVALGLDALTERWKRANGYVPLTPAPATESDQPREIRREARAEQRDEIHVGTAHPGPINLPDGRRVEIGDGLVILSTYRFAQLVEAARFGRQPTDI